jgi:hypothetical protein
MMAAPKHLEIFENHCGWEAVVARKKAISDGVEHMAVLDAVEYNLP